MLLEEMSNTLVSGPMDRITRR